MSESLSEEQRNQCGRFQSNETTQRAWDRTQEIATALDARAILFQTPKSFEPTAENLDNLRTLFSKIDRQNRIIPFEPRGPDWTHDLMTNLTNELNFVHCVDPFLQKPVTSGLRYFRLHGKPEYTYGYEYTAQDLDELQDRIPEEEPAWILFNNQTMADDARTLQNRLALEDS